MLLAQVSDVLSDLGFESMTDITSAATMALDAAEEQLAAALNTEFGQGTFTDTFFIREPYGDRSSNEFRLSRGFVSSLTSVLVNPDLASLTGQTTQIGDWGSLVEIAPSGGNVDVTAMVQLDSDKGIVKDIQNRYRRHYVQITYQAGFPIDGADPRQLPPEPPCRTGCSRPPSSPRSSASPTRRRWSRPTSRSTSS